MKLVYSCTKKEIDYDHREFFLNKVSELIDLENELFELETSSENLIYCSQ
jgi:hypothetical protein